MDSSGHQTNFTSQTLAFLWTGPDKEKNFLMMFVRIHVRIVDHPHPLVCRKRRLNEAVLQMRPEKPRPRVTASVAR
jgi:hypothetical protein